MSDIPNNIVRSFLKKYGADHSMDANSKSHFKLHHTIISIPEKGLMDFRQFYDIGENQMELSVWEIDYFLGENGIVP